MKEITREQVHREVDNLIDLSDDFANININVKKHLGIVGKLDSTQMTLLRLPSNPAYVTKIQSISRHKEQSKFSGSQSLVIIYENGIIKQLQVQDYRKIHI